MEEQGSTWQALLGLLGIRGAGQESTIQEQWHSPLESRNRVQVRQWLAAILAFLAIWLGLFLVGWPVWLADAVETWADAVLVGTFALLAGMMWFSAVELTLKGYAVWGRRIVELLGVTLILAAIALVCTRFGDGEWWYNWAILIGLSILAPSVALAFNQLKQMFDPMGWTSPFEQRMLHLVEKVLGGASDAPKIEERPLIPWRHGKREGQIIATRDREDVIEVPAREDLNLADFLQEAMERGLGRAAWLKKGHARYVLPETGDRVTRGTYDKMIQMAARAGYIRIGGDGDAAAWLTEPDAAYDDWCTRFEDEWGEMLDGDYDD